MSPVWKWFVLASAVNVVRLRLLWCDHILAMTGEILVPTYSAHAVSERDSTLIRRAARCSNPILIRLCCSLSDILEQRIMDSTNCDNCKFCVCIISDAEAFNNHRQLYGSVGVKWRHQINTIASAHSRELNNIRFGRRHAWMLVVQFSIWVTFLVIQFLMLPFIICVLIIIYAEWRMIVTQYTVKNILIHKLITFG